MTHAASEEIYHFLLIPDFSPGKTILPVNSSG